MNRQEVKRLAAAWLLASPAELRARCAGLRPHRNNLAPFPYPRRPSTEAPWHRRIFLFPIINGIFPTRAVLLLPTALLFLPALFLASPAWAQATNQLYMTGTGSGSSPTIFTNGVDTNINLAIMPKGTGGVGVGTTSPQATLHVNGGAIVGNDAASCTGTNAGEIIWNGTTMEYCTGSAWTPFSCGARTPLQIFGSNLVAWYDASDASSITQSSGAVSQWNDKSGNGHHLVQATGANKPTYSATGSVNSKPALTFNGTSTYLSKSGITELSGGVVSVFVVYSETAGVAGDRIISLTDTTQTQDWNNSTSIVPVYNGVVGAYRNGQLSEYTVAVTDGVQYRIYSITDGANNTVYVNSVAQTAVATSGALATNLELWVGAGKGVGSWLNGKISEIIITKNAATLQQRVDVDSYFQMRW